jgi:hypothetical protein
VDTLVVQGEEKAWTVRAELHGYFQSSE